MEEKVRSCGENACHGRDGVAIGRGEERLHDGGVAFGTEEERLVDNGVAFGGGEVRLRDGGVDICS